MRWRAGEPGRGARALNTPAGPESHDGLPPLADQPVVDAEVVGLPAVVTIRIPGGPVPGEVRLRVRGTVEHLIAYAVEPLEIGRHVLVSRSRGARSAEVEPTINGV